MAISTVDRACMAVLLMLAVPIAFAAQGDAALTLPAAGGAVTNATTLVASAVAFGALVQSYATIVGIWYVAKSCMLFSYISGGKAQPNQTMGSVLSHFVAGTLAYNSDKFFQMVHNTIPMIPDFGKLVYEAELIKSLVQ